MLNPPATPRRVASRVTALVIYGVAVALLVFILSGFYKAPSKLSRSEPTRADPIVRPNWDVPAAATRPAKAPRAESHERATSPPPRPAARPKAPPTATHRIGVGETFSSIAASLGTNVATIEELNPDIDAHALHVGQSIRVPG